MKKVLLILITLCTTQVSLAQQESAFGDGEWFKFRMSYSGFLKAGNATLTVKDTKLDDKEVYHVVGKGWTTGMIKWFFKVKDDYQSYFDIETGKPYLFKRKINEGGYKKNRHITFDQENNTAYVQDFIKKKESTISVTGPQDMISTFYFLRSYNTKGMKKGEEIKVNMFFDNKSYPFRLRFLGNETLKTKFGKIKTQKFRPLVQSGRVFKAKESVTVWITADDNKIPIKMKASLAVGSLRADLEAYKGLANPFEVIF